MSYFDGKIMKGSQIGVILISPNTDNEREIINKQKESLEKHIGQEMRFEYNPKRDAYLLRKYFELIGLANKHLPESILFKFINRYALPQWRPATTELQVDCLRKGIMLKLGFCKTEFTLQGGELHAQDVALSLKKIDNETFMDLYRQTRDLIFAECELQGMDDLQMFETFGCLYLGIPLAETQKIEVELGNTPFEKVAPYLRTIKQMGVFITQEQFSKLKTQ